MRNIEFDIKVAVNQGLGLLASFFEVAANVHKRLAEQLRETRI